MPSDLKAPARIPVLGALAISCVCVSQLSGQSPAAQFRAAMVHGAGVEQPFILHEDAWAAQCLWFFTYNFYSSQSTAILPDTVAAVTISFINEPEWQEWQGRSSRRSGTDDVPTASWHTRIALAPLNAPVSVQFQKPTSPGFVTRIHLHSAAEPYLALRAIPTRRDTLGRPLVRQYDSETLADLRSELERNLGPYLPQCRY
jgi:hypothetical protein